MKRLGRIGLRLSCDGLYCFICGMCNLALGVVVVIYFVSFEGSSCVGFVALHGLERERESGDELRKLLCCLGRQEQESVCTISFM